MLLNPTLQAGAQRQETMVPIKPTCIPLPRGLGRKNQQRWELSALPGVVWLAVPPPSGLIQSRPVPALVFERVQRGLSGRALRRWAGAEAGRECVQQGAAAFSVCLALCRGGGVG